MPIYFEFEVTLVDTDPLISRRFLLDATGTFGDLHLAIRDSFEWNGDHLWDFRTAARSRRTERLLASVPDDDMGMWDSGDRPDAWRVPLTTHFKRVGTACRYVYDYGDDWVHHVKLRQRVPSRERFERRLVAGSLAAPIEDCGGIGGHYRMAEFVETGTDPWGDDSGETAEWIGDWKPDQFDLPSAKSAFDR